MLEVVLELGFPLFVVERSPLLTRDLDLLQQINQSAWVGVVYSISNLDQELKLAFEPRSPGCVADCRPCSSWRKRASWSEPR